MHKRLMTLVVCCLVVLTAFSQKTYLVAVGLEVYENAWCNPLPCSTRDANGIARFFKSYDGTEPFVLLDANATRDNILKVLRTQFAKASYDDNIIFAYSGHGYNGGVTCYGKQKFISCSEIQEIMKNSNAKNKMMFVQSCHSGSFKRQSSAEEKKQATVYNKSNVLLMLSSRANEESWESGGMLNSFFYDAILKGLSGRADKNSDKKVTARELFNYVYYKVKTNGDELTKLAMERGDTRSRSQHPQFFGSFDDNMVIVTVK